MIETNGHTLPAVTQLFTEPYMVKFLLHNTIGAWWCARHGIKGPHGGAGVPNGQAPVEMEYLRWRDDGIPAAGTFDGWPDSLKEFTMLDPCCGSGHFLVEAFNLLVPMRMHDEGLSAQEACDAVLAENLFGLELDPRCTQIAAFALALAAWKYPGESGEPLGHRELPKLNIACSGQSVTGRKEEWLALANGDEKLKNGMEKLYDLFRQAPHLGSLIDPGRELGDLFTAEFAQLRPLLERALEKETVQQDEDAAAVGVAAQGIAKAAETLAKQYTVVATNVPYRTQKSLAPVLLDYGKNYSPNAVADLATMFVSRTLKMMTEGGSAALVTPQNWLFLKAYTCFRTQLLNQYHWQMLTRLGPRAFETITGEVVKATLLILSRSSPADELSVCCIDASTSPNAVQKAHKLRGSTHTLINQCVQLKNPDARVVLTDSKDTQLDGACLLSEISTSLAGCLAGDAVRFIRFFWEVPHKGNDWEYLQSTVKTNCEYGGRSQIIFWQGERGEIAEFAESVKHLNHMAQNWRRGKPNWGKKGVAISQMGDLACTLYMVDIYDHNTAVIVPNDENNVGALWAFCSSDEFVDAIRKIDQMLKVTNATMVKIPIQLARWEAIFREKYPSGPPSPYSDDPTQWLFKGTIHSSTALLQVAVARLVSYRWPEQPKEHDAIDARADKDGIVCIPAVRGERPAAERLLDVLRAAYSSEGSNATLHKLLFDAGCRPGSSLDEGLRDTFFEQHCKQFHNRPFIWHIWDGRKDGFSCLVNYHKLNHKLLETLTYSYLQDWITAQAAAAKDGKPGADLRLVAAQELQNKLKLILAGEPPYDIFVRWKPIEEQPIGWNPDLNDGVRSNIRPFMTADVLRKQPNINWSKDRGKEPQRDQNQYPWFWKDGKFTGDRINDYHLTNAQKRAARGEVATGQRR